MCWKKIVVLGRSEGEGDRGVGYNYGGAEESEVRVAHVRQATQANCGCARTNCSDNFFNKTNKYTISNAAIHNYIYMTLLI